jgi:hypothetical protein
VRDSLAARDGGLGLRVSPTLLVSVSIIVGRRIEERQQHGVRREIIQVAKGRRDHLCGKVIDAS